VYTRQARINMLIGIVFSFTHIFANSQEFKHLYAEAYNNINTNPNKALMLAIEANKIADASNNLKQIADSHYLMGYLNNKGKKYNDALINYYKALKLYRTLADDNLVIDVLSNLGEIFSVNFSYRNSIKYYREALAINKDTRGLKYADTYRNLAREYRLAGQYDSAMIINEKALQLFSDYDDKNKISITYNEIGIILDELGKYNEAIDYYFKALLMVEGTNYEPFRRAKTYNNAGIAYLLQENFIKASLYFTKSINLKEAIPGFDIASKMSTLNNLAEIHKKEGNIDSAKYFYLKSLATANTKDPQNKELRVCLEELKNLAEIEGDLQKENEYLKLLAETYNSLLDDKLNYQRLYSFQEIQTTLYKIEKQERDVLIQQQRRTNLLIYGLIAICFGLVVAMMFIYSSRKRKVKRRLVEELNEML